LRITEFIWVFGIFYAMVNVGASVGPVVMGRLRAISWNNAFLAGVVAVGLMLLITIIFYKEPERKTEGTTLKYKFKEKVNFYLQFQTIKFIFI